MISYHSFSKETNMLHISEGESTYAALEFCAINSNDKQTMGREWKHKGLSIMATLSRFFVSFKLQ